MEAEIGSIDFEGHLAHARVERVGRDRVRGLRRALEVDFAVAGKMSVRPHIALSENRETALARRETRFRCVEVLALPERDEVVDRARIGSEVAGPIDVGEVDPAAERQRNAFVADLSGRTCIDWRCLVGGRRLTDRFGLRFDCPFLSSLIVHPLLKLLQLGLEDTNLGCGIVVRKSLACRDECPADKYAFE